LLLREAYPSCASGELTVRSLLERTLGRGVNLPGSVVFADLEKVLYGPQQLRGAAQSWWESYLATHANPEAFTWEEFRDNFRRYHVPEGLMIVRKEEFLALKQGPLSVREYRDKFLQLSCYALEDVNMDAKRQYRFLRGLVDPLHYQLMNHTFPTFQHLIDRAIMTERKRREMEDRKRKIGGP
jgi:hypothetical protein